MNCYDCKYYDTDYVFDGEDEYEIGNCEAGHNEHLDSDEECPHFKKYRHRKCDEEDTECDKCEFLKQCNEDGCVINCTTRYDGKEHFIKGLGVICRK